MKVVIHPELAYHSQTNATDPCGAWLPSINVDHWIAWMIEQSDDSATRYFRLPNEGGLIALSRNPLGTLSHQTLVPLQAKRLTSSDQVELWLPSDSQIEPIIPDHWLAKSLPAGEAVVSVWLPRIGLVVFEASDHIHLSSLLSPPMNLGESAAWQSPPDVPVLPTRLAGLTLKMPMTSEEILGNQAIAGEGPDIGDQASGLSDLTDEQKSSTDKFKSWLLSKMESMANDNAADHQDPGKETSANPSGSGSGLGPMKSAMAGLISNNVKKERDAQLSKLLEMTKIDPDKALRFAIPLAGAAAGLAAFRGLAIPGAKLLSRMPNFSLGSIGGGAGPADFWDVDPAVRARLLKAYNEMANREVAAGRFRRAAYIHANLLGNLPNAASVLEQGGFFQEAAVVYRDKLDRPADAARCLMAAGLFEQSAELYAKLKDHPNECLAWQRAGRDDLAEAALEKAVASLIARHQIVEAAKFIADHFGDDERALKLLTDQWPNGHQIQSSMQLAFEWIGKRHAHDQARGQLDRCIESTTRTRRVALVELTRDVAKRYPDRSLQQYAADQCRVAAALVLSEPRSTSATDSDASNQTLGLLRTLEGPDSGSDSGSGSGSAFASDVDRFRKLSRDTKPKTLSRRVSKSNRRIQALEPLVFSEATYQCFGMWKQQLFALYRADSEIHAYLFDHPSRPQLQTEHCRFVSVPDPLASRPMDRLDSELLVTDFKLFLRSPFPEPWFPKFAFDTEVSKIHVHGAWPGNLENVDAAVALEDGGFAALQTFEGETQLLVCNQIGLTYRSHSLTSLLQMASFDEFNSDWEGVTGEPPCLETTHIATLDQQIVVAVGDTLVVRPDSDNALVQPIGHRIHALETSPLNSRKRIAVAHEGGLDVYWAEMGELIRQRIETDRPFQKAIFMKDGGLFATSDQTLYRYQLKRDSIVNDGQMKLKHPNPVSLLPLSHSVCGVAHRAGVIERFQ